MKQNVRYLVLALVFLVPHGNFFCQKVLFPELNPVNGHFDNFLIEEGRADPTTISLLQDKKGFIWSGTSTGLYRFDGIRYVKYGLGNNDSSLLGYMILCIMEDSEGTIWAGTFGALNRLDLRSDNISHFLPDTSDYASPDNIVRYVFEDSKGFLWLKTDGNIFRFDRKSEIFTSFKVDTAVIDPTSLESFTRADYFYEDKYGGIWIGSSDGLYLYRYEDDSWTKIYPGNGGQGGQNLCKINCITTDNDDVIWCGTETDGLIRITDPEKCTVDKIIIKENRQNGLSVKNISAICADIDGILWIFGENLLWRYNLENGETKDYSFADKPYFDRKWQQNLRIDKIFPEDDQSLWLLSLRNGYLFHFDPVTEKLSLFTNPRYICLDCIRDNTGNFWFGCAVQNNFRLQTDSLPFIERIIPNSGTLYSLRRTRIYEDENGSLWLALSGGVYRIKDSDIRSAPGYEKVEITNEPLASHCIHRGRDGNFWIGCEKGIIIKYNPINKQSQKSQISTVQNSQNSGAIEIIREDSQGDIWFATYGEGIFRLSITNNSIDRFLTYEEMPEKNFGPFLFDFLIDAADHLWIATFDGLFRTDKYKTEITNYTGFDRTGRTYGSFNYRIVEDNSRNVWILNSLNGPYLFDSSLGSFKNIWNFADNSAFSCIDMVIDRCNRLWIERYDRITVIDTLTKTSKDIMLQDWAFDPQSFASREGEIIYVMNDKLLIFPDPMPYNSKIPPVYITRLLINEKDINEIIPDIDYLPDIKKISLECKQNNLKIEYAALNYLQPDHNKYRYFMNGIDNDTILTGPGFSAEYKQMTPGRYNFWVTGSNNDGVWNRTGTSLEILIRPPWYRSVLAFVFYTIFFISSVTGFIRFRTYRLRKDKIKLEAQVEAATAELEFKNRQLEEIDRIKTHFFTDISHEIRTPLSLILGPLENISKEEMLSSRMTVMVDLMKRNARRLMHLVDQLLDISRLDAGKMKIVLVEDDIVKCLRILIYEFLSMAESKHIKYVAELPDKAFKTWFDRDKIEKIISNLLSNAFKYTPLEGEVQCIVKINSDKSKYQQYLLEIVVRDSGPGIYKEHQSRIFDRFYRIEGHHEAERHGTGIGLSLVQEFVTLLHGEIKLRSSPEHGSEFTVTIPLGRDHLSTAEYIVSGLSSKITDRHVVEVFKKQMVTETLKDFVKGKMKVLIIEDNDDMRRFIKESLHEDYAILEAENGAAGINIALTMMPDLIVTDIMMPDLDGIKLCFQLKNDEHTSHIPIIMLTAKATTDDKIVGLKSGADDYIIKPFNMTELRTRISNLLNSRDLLRLKYDKLHILEKSKWIPESVDDKFMARLFKIVNDNIGNHNFDVGSLNDHLGMSKPHLTRKIKILTGLTPGVLIRNIRLEKAADLLRTKAGNITEIANSVGISNPSNFTKAFRNYFGVSPKDYWKK